MKIHTHYSVFRNGFELTFATLIILLVSSCGSNSSSSNNPEDDTSTSYRVTTLTSHLGEGANEESYATQTFQYDDQGKLTAYRYSVILDEHNVSTSVTYYDYNPLGQRISARETDESGNTSTQSDTYDATGNLIKQTKQHSLGNRSTATYNYNEAGQIQQVFSIQLIRGSPLYSTLNLSYNSQGKLLSVSTFVLDGTETRKGTDTYTYDSNGTASKISVINSKGSLSTETTTYEYDTSGKRTQETEKNNRLFGGRAHTIRYYYEAKTCTYFYVPKTVKYLLTEPCK